MEQSLNECITVWKTFLASHNWQDLIKGYSAQQPRGGFLVYELPNFLERPNEGFAIVDMRDASFVPPHYHPEGIWEIYFVLQGKALVVLAGKEFEMRTGNVAIVPPKQAHFIIPDDNFVLALVNTPPYQPREHIPCTESDASVGFDKDQFDRLMQHLK